jgi:predicted DNA-binding WGR domain protein
VIPDPVVVRMIDLTWYNKSGRAAKFYRLEIIPGLFGDWSLVHHWGNIDEPGETRTEWFKTETQAKQARFGSLRDLCGLMVSDASAAIPDVVVGT